MALPTVSDFRTAYPEFDDPVVAAPDRRQMIAPDGSPVKLGHLEPIGRWRGAPSEASGVKLDARHHRFEPGDDA